MSRIPGDLQIVINRFPEHADSLKKHFLRNTKFRGICEDYRRCLRALVYWTEVKGKESERPREDYAILLTELDNEIIEFLEEQSSKGSLVHIKWNQQLSDDE